MSSSTSLPASKTALLAQEAVDIRCRDMRVRLYRDMRVRLYRDMRVRLYAPPFEVLEHLQWVELADFRALFQNYQQGAGNTQVLIMLGRS